MDSIYCKGEMNDYLSTPEIYEILRHGITPQSLLDTSRLIRDKEGSKFLLLPVGMYTEAQAFGAETSLTTNGILIRNYKYQTVSELSNLTSPNFTDSALKTVLDCIELAKNENIILKVSGPFGILSSLIEPMLLYKSLLKDKAVIKNALELITEGLTQYIKQSAQRGVKIISLAEPTALTEIMGIRNYMEFSGDYCIKLLKNLQYSADNIIVHICGKNSAALENCGLVFHHERFCEGSTYWDALLRLSENSGVTFTGKRCMMNPDSYNNKVWELSLENSGRL